MGLIALHSSKDVASRAACGVLKHGLEIHHEKMDIFSCVNGKIIELSGGFSSPDLITRG